MFTAVYVSASPLTLLLCEPRWAGRMDVLGRRCPITVPRADLSKRRPRFGTLYAHRTVPAGRREEVMTFRSFVGAGVLFFVLTGAARNGEADPVILSGFLTKTGAFSDFAPVEFEATEDFSFRGISIAGPGPQTCWQLGCSPGSTVGLGGSGDVRGTVMIGPETWTTQFGAFISLNFSGSAMLPAVLEPTGVVSAPFSVTGVWLFPPMSPPHDPFRIPFSGSGTVTAFLVQTSFPNPAGRWQVRRLEYVFGSDVEPKPEPSTLLLFAIGLAAMARRQFAPPPERPMT